MTAMARWSLPLMVLASAGCSAAAPKERSTMNASSTDGAATLKRIGLRLPPSGTIEYTRYLPGMDDGAWLQLTMTAADWTSFLDGIVRKAPRPPEFLEEANPLLGPRQDGWNPEAVKGLKTGQVAWGVNQSEGLNIGFAPADGGKIQVFLFWHQT